MKSTIYTCLLLLSGINALAQNTHPVRTITEMKWGLDYQIYLKMANDSSYSLDVADLFHVTSNAGEKYSTEFVYYPVSLGEEFVDVVRNKEGKMNESESNSKTDKTLWSALHNSLGGGWIHFTNCLLYALETENLSLTAPLMVRPETNWKPKPMTETYQRTRKWEYYVPVDQKLAQKEYKIRFENDQLGDLKNIPPSFINLFLETNNREYQEFKEAGDKNTLAKIDLVKLYLGVNYLSEPQITYIKNAVFNAVKKYAVNKLPSVVIFDDFAAAAAMTLNNEGYHIEQIVFSDEASLDEFEIQKRSKAIHDIIHDINIYNQKAFQQRLKNYYKM